MSENKKISLIMPTYNREFIIELAVLSIIHQKEHNWKIELLIGDDGDDNSEFIVNKLENTNPLLSIQYFKMDRISISDKVNFLIRKSNGEYYGLIGSDDMQSPYKISSFEKTLNENPNTEVFGQRSFIYHDIILNKSKLWSQNRAMKFFKAGSFVIIKRSLFEKAGGYPVGLWKRVDGAFYKKIVPLKPLIYDVSKFDVRVINTSLALQHIDNIWGRDAKGLQNDKPKQLANFLSEPTEIEIEKIFPEINKKFNSIKNNLIQKIKQSHCIEESEEVSVSNLKILNILIVVSLDMQKQNSASNIRPAKLIQAFKKTIHKIDVIDAPDRNRQRNNIIKSIIKNIFQNKKYDLCYYEPSTYPLQRTERLLIHWLRKQNTWISYFHRDMYWRYEIGIDSQSSKKNEKHKLRQEYNLNFLEKKIDLLFTPTNLYAEKLKSTLKTIALPPAGNAYNIEYDADKRDGVIYVGGVSDRYGTRILLQSFKKINENYNIPLTIVCRLKTELLLDYIDCSWLNIQHWNNSQIQKQYSKFKIAIIPIEKSKYHEFALPFKLFEYASFGLPIAASNNFEQVKLIEENKLGINIGSTVESFSKKLVDFYTNVELLNQYHQYSMKFIEKKGLWEHRVDTIIKQFREQNAG
jgi:glycosyltransferase involved in cell wall biosynthesis